MAGHSWQSCCAGAAVSHCTLQPQPTSLACNSRRPCTGREPRHAAGQSRRLAPCVSVAPAYTRLGGRRQKERILQPKAVARHDSRDRRGAKERNRSFERWEDGTPPPHISASGTRFFWTESSFLHNSFLTTVLRSEIGAVVFFFGGCCWRLFENSLRWSPSTHLTASVKGLSRSDRRFLDVLCANSRNCGLAVELTPFLETSYASLREGSARSDLETSNYRCCGMSAPWLPPLRASPFPPLELSQLRCVREMPPCRPLPWRPLLSLTPLAHSSSESDSGGAHDRTYDRSKAGGQSAV